MELQRLKKLPMFVVKSIRKLSVDVNTMKTNLVKITLIFMASSIRNQQVIWKYAVILSTHYYLSWQKAYSSFFFSHNLRTYHTVLSLYYPLMFKKKQKCIRSLLEATYTQRSPNNISAKISLKPLNAFCRYFNISLI